MALPCFPFAASSLSKLFFSSLTRPTTAYSPDFHLPLVGVVSSPTRDRRVQWRCLDGLGSHREKLTQPWKYFFSNRPELPDNNRLDKTSHQWFEYKGTTKPSWPNDRRKLTLLNARRDTLDFQMRSAAGNQAAGQNQLWSNPFSNVSELRDDRMDMSPCYSDLKHNRARDLLRLKEQNNRLWLEFRLATLGVDAPQQGTPKGLQDCSSLVLGDEFQSLCDKGHLDRALDVLLDMYHQGAIPSRNMYCSILKTCSKRKALTQAKRVHAHLARCGLVSTRCLGEYLVLTLVKCGGLDDALGLLHSLPRRTVFCWTAVISGYTDLRKGQEALEMYHCMREEGVEPNEYTFASLLKACGMVTEKERADTVPKRLTKVMPLHIGRAFHTDALNKGLDSYVFVGSTLVSMYGKCGSIGEAEHVFCQLSHPDVVSWNAMLSAYVEHCEGEKALQLYIQMQEEGVTPNKPSIVTALQACFKCAEREGAVLVERRSTKAISVEIGLALHDDALRKGFDSHLFVGNALISMYGKFGNLVEATSVFNGLYQNDVVSWTAMLSAYLEQDEGNSVLQVYRQMEEKGVSPNERTLVITLQACCKLAEKEVAVVVNGRLVKMISLEIGMALHADAQNKGFDPHIFVGNTLVSMYGKCGSLVEAESVFGGMSQCNVVSWTAMLSAYVEQSEGEKALQLYRQMQEQGISPNERTFVIALQACCLLAEKEGQRTKLMALEIGQSLHGDAWRRGFGSNAFVSNTLVSMYGKCGSLVEAENVFDGLSQHDVVPWTTMLSVYVEQGEGECALQLYRQMQEEGVTLDDATLVCVLQACRETGSVDFCRHIHFTTVSAGYDPIHLVANTLIHAYGDCVSMADAQAVFDTLSLPNVVSWTGLIAGYAREGNCTASFEKFGEMLMEGIKPDEITFLSILYACCHTGLVDKGVELFEFMSRDYGISPEIEHYGVMVDLLGRAGDFKRVEDMLLRMPIQPDLVIWSCLLSACLNHGNVELGKQVFDRVVHLQPNQAAAHVLMSNIYADAGQLHCGNELDKSRQGVWKRSVQS